MYAPIAAAAASTDDVIPECTSHRLVVHLWLVLVQAPQPRHGLRVDELEDAALAIRPLDEARTVVVVLQQLEQELPQVRAACTPTNTTPMYSYHHVTSSYAQVGWQ